MNGASRVFLPVLPLSAGSLGRRVWAWVATGLFVCGLRAHDPGLSTAQADWRDSSLEIAVGFAPADALQLLPPPARTTTAWSEADFARVKAPLAELADKLWQVKVDGRRISPREVAVSLGDRDSVNFRFVYPCPSGLLELRAEQLGSLPPAHRQFLIIADERGSTLASKLLSAADPVIQIRRAEASSAPVALKSPGWRAFMWLGMEHIWSGYDHLLFLFALLIVCRSFRSIVAIVSCFTLAHSLTLALATFDVVTIPSAIVEPAIAASIVYVGAENLWRRGAEPRGRGALTFAFGLVHGFGFASVLRELGVGGAGRGVVMPLLNFNLGVELGQVLIAALVLPIVWRLRKRERFVALGVPVLSGAVMLAGGYWFVHRTFLA